MNKQHNDLKKNNRKTLAFFGTSTDNDIVRAQWPGILYACKKYDINLIFIAGGHSSGDTTVTRLDLIFDLVKAETVDGIICWSSILFNNIPVKKREEFLNRYNSVPIVSQGEIIDGYPSFIIDNYQGVSDVLTHLIQVHGFRRIAFSRGPADHVYAEERFRAYKDVLTAHGIPISRIQIILKNFKNLVANLLQFLMYQN